MTDRYAEMFARTGSAGEGAFIPFAVLGDPDLETSFRIIETLVQAGADALELGFPFSDPVADGPVIQQAGSRALKAGATMREGFALVSRIRKAYPALPLGLLVYANLVEAKGRGAFFRATKRTGADSVLIADVPHAESAPYRDAARQAGIHLVLILPLHADAEAITKIAPASSGYLYLLSRKGITGAGQKAGLPSSRLIKRLVELGAPPAVLGFGVSKPAQVRQAIKAGCRGVISGSAVVKLVEGLAAGEKTLSDLSAFIRAMKAATIPTYDKDARSKSRGRGKAARPA